MPQRTYAILGLALVVVFVGAFFVRPASQEAEVVDVVLPDPVAAALLDAEARLEGFVSLRYTRVLGADDAATAFVLTFDPAREPGTWWLPAHGDGGASGGVSGGVSGDSSAGEAPGLSVRQRDILEQANAGASVFGDVVLATPDRLGGVLYGLVEETDAGWVYHADAGMVDDQFNDVAAHVRVALHVAKTPDGPVLSSYRVFAPEPFKPNPAARMDVYEVVLTYGEAWAGGPIVVTEALTQVKGAAFFKGFEETVVVRNGDFAPVDAVNTGQDGA